MHRDALVEPEQAAAVRALDHLDELVERVLLVQQPGSALTAPGGTATSAASAAARTSARRPRRNDAESASSAAVPSSVRCVPMSGIAISAGTKVPTSEPAVESA